MSTKKTSAEEFAPRTTNTGAFNLNTAELPPQSSSVVLPSTTNTEVKSENAPENLLFDIMGMAALVGQDSYDKSQSLNYYLYLHGGKLLKTLHLTHVPTRSMGIKFFPKTEKIQEGLIYNQELTLEEYKFLTEVKVKRDAEYIVDHIGDFYPDKVNNDRWKKKSREDQIDDILDAFQSPFVRGVKKESEEKNKTNASQMTDSDYYPPSWKIKVILNKDTNMPECNIYIRDSDGSVRLLYGHPQTVLPYQLQHKDANIRAKFIQDYKDSLIPFMANNAKEGFTNENIIPKYCEAAPIWDYLGISVVQGKWTYSTRLRQVLITKEPESREYHTPGTIAPCLFPGVQVKQIMHGEQQQHMIENNEDVVMG